MFENSTKFWLSYGGYSMKGRKSKSLTIIFVLAASLLSTSITAFLMTNHFSYINFQMLGSVCQKIVEKQPDLMQTVLTTIKELKNQSEIQAGENILLSLGYRQSDFFEPFSKKDHILYRYWPCFGYFHGSSFLLVLA